jgi:hypothetical protein
MGVEELREGIRKMSKKQIVKISFISIWFISSVIWAYYSFFQGIPLCVPWGSTHYLFWHFLFWCISGIMAIVSSIISFCILFRNIF